MNKVLFSNRLEISGAAARVQVLLRTLTNAGKISFAEILPIPEDLTPLSKTAWILTHWGCSGSFARYVLSQMLWDENHQMSISLRFETDGKPAVFAVKRIQELFPELAINWKCCESAENSNADDPLQFDAVFQKGRIIDLAKIAKTAPHDGDSLDLLLQKVKLSWKVLAFRTNRFCENLFYQSRTLL